MRTQQERGYLEAKKREPSLETNPACTSILDFQSVELLENKFLFFEATQSVVFVRAVRAD